MSLNPYILPPLFCALFALGMTLFVFLKNPRSPINQIFSLLCIETFFWQVCWLVSYFLAGPLAWDLIIRVAWTIVVFIPFTYYHFAIVFLNLPAEKKWVKLAYVFGAIFMVLIWSSDLFIAGYQEFWWGYYTRGGLLFTLYLAGVFWCMLRTLFLVFRSAGSEKNRIRKNKLTYVAAAQLLFSLATIEYLIAYGVSFYPIAPFVLIASWLVITFAIVRHRLLEIEIVIKKTAIYSILTALLSGLFLAIIFIGNYFLGSYLGQFSIWFGIVASFVVAIIFQPLRGRIQKFVDRLFFKGKYDYRETLKNLSQTSTSIIDLDQLISLVTQNVIDTLKVDKAQIFLLDNDRYSLRQ
ncbi:histidine kinase N-terminal 7TM domain-containing protein [Candidatus Margulisiibacteriota bacterium]